jgi:hypothetical protein
MSDHVSFCCKCVEPGEPARRERIKAPPALGPNEAESRRNRDSDEGDRDE